MIAGELGPLDGPGSHARRGSACSTETRRRQGPRPAARTSGSGGGCRRDGMTPYFPCLDDNCGRRCLVRRRPNADVERLTCPICGAQTLPGTLALTRESLKANPPDILFSSTEMLSKQATSWDIGHAARVERRQRHPPGASRRGPHLLRGPRCAGRADAAPLALRDPPQRQRHPVLVGLSATLLDAGDFMATMTGVDAPGSTPSRRSDGPASDQPGVRPGAARRSGLGRRHCSRPRSRPGCCSPACWTTSPASTAR